MNITESIARNAEAFPERIALLVDGKPYTYQFLWQNVLAVGGRLGEAGVRKGDGVAVGLAGYASFVIAILALARMGAVASLFFPGVQPEKIAMTLRRHAPKFLLADPGYQFDGVATVSVEPLDFDTIFAPLGGGSVRTPMDMEADNLPWWIGTTSGTTGTSKSVARTHAREALLSAVYPGADHDYYQRVAIWQAPRTSFGMSAVLRVLKEGTTAILSQHLTGDSFLVRLLGDRPTCVITSTGTATSLVQYLRNSTVKKEDYRSIVLRFVMGGSVATPKLVADLKELICEQIEIRYASSESGLLAVLDEDCRAHRPECQGRVLPWVQAQALDEDGSVLPAGQIGILRFSTPFTVDGYVNDPEATSKYFRDGWHYPGDQGAVDAAGYMYLTGRSDAVLNLGGNKIDAQRIEAVLNSHPAVLESVVVAFSMSEGQIAKLVAVVVANRSVDRKVLKQLCRDRAGQKFVPDHIIFTSSLPKNDGGKVMRNTVLSMLKLKPKGVPSHAQ